jgi:hypothetical protein
MFHRYHYEAEFYLSQSRIPLDVRMKLDLLGLKISLKDWLACSFEERTVLCHLPVSCAEEKQVFTGYIDFLCRKYRAKAVEVTAALDPVLWSSSAVPEVVAQKSASCSDAVTLAEWQSWESYQRYALYKTAISKSQPEAFADILDELRAAKTSFGSS